MSEGGKSLPSKDILSATVNATNNTLTPAISNTSAHLCKTSEHGAALYLTYGENTNLVSVNTNGKTGGDTTEINIYKNNNAMSSTKNPTGVYDLCTTNGEFVAGKIVNSDTSNTKILTNYLKSNPAKIKGDAINDSEEAIINCISSNPNQVAVTSMNANQFIIFGKKRSSTESNMFYCESGTTARL